MLTREQFLALPTAEQLWELYMEQTTEREAPAAKPAQPAAGKPHHSAPRYDGQIARKGGMAVWMSEMLLEDLRYWHDRNANSTDEKYGEKNRQQAKVLSYWLKYREVAPLERWTGLRGDDVVTALAPSRDPEEHVWAKRGDAKPPAPSGPAFGDAEDAEIFGDAGKAPVMAEKEPWDE
jgi:hypothetical protein